MSRCHVQAIAHPVMCFVTNGHLTRDRARDGAIITNYKLSTRGAQQPETVHESMRSLLIDWELML